MSFFLVFTSVLALLHFYVGVRALVDTRVARPWNLLGWLGVLVLAASVPSTFLLERFLSHEQAFVPAFLAYTWLGCLFYLWLFFVTRDAVRVAWFLLRAPKRVFAWLSRRLRTTKVSADSLEHDAPADPQRRVFVSRVVAAGAAVATFGIGASGMRSALSEITVAELTVRLRRLPKALDGFRIAQLSDVHIGPLLGERFLADVVAETNRLRPDLVAITGDLVDGSVRTLGPQVARLADLRARYGTVFVTGNHEYYSGCDEWVMFLERLGIRVLMNERLSIGDESGGASFDLLGVPDHHAAQSHPIAADAVLAARGRDPERELVVLAHQPVQITQALSVGAGLQLSGHTHGGQMQPFGQLVALAQPYVAGLHQQADTQIYVSRGTGFWGPPMRVLAPAEITSIRLVAA